MENVVDALKMAGSVLLFVIALSVAILTFSQARETIDAVLKNADREALTIERDERYYYLSNDNDTNRYVGKETIIPAIYRAYKESFKIIFKFPEEDYYLFKNKAGEKISKIDLAEQSIATDLRSRQFLDGIIYGKYAYEDGKIQADYETLFKIKRDTLPLYDYITDKIENDDYKIKEELGTYYIEDLVPEGASPDGKANVEEINKQEKRVITYTFIK